LAASDLKEYYKGTNMRLLLAMLLGAAGLVLPGAAFAESDDVEATIVNVDEDHQFVTLNDGRKYQTPQEFDFDGLKKGVKVAIYYTQTDGRREINDLQIIS